MYYSRKKTTEEVQDELTAIWACSSENCNGWMRDNFTFSEEPLCSICHSSMVRDERMLVSVVNHSHAQVHNAK